MNDAGRPDVQSQRALRLVEPKRLASLLAVAVAPNGSASTSNTPHNGVAFNSTGSVIQRMPEECRARAAVSNADHRSSRMSEDIFSQLQETPYCTCVSNDSRQIEQQKQGE
jgi:hypothetical protein